MSIAASGVGDNISEYEREISRLNISRKRRLVAVLCAYGDDSWDSSKSRVFAVGSAVGTQEDWDEFSIAWKARTGSRPFHATDCDSDQGEYSKTSHKANKQLYKDLATLLSHQKKFVTFGIAADIKGFESAFPGTDKEYLYYLGFSAVLASCLSVGYLSVPRESIKLTFDRNMEREASTVALYDFVSKFEEFKMHPIMHEEVSFADHRKCVPIQVADLVAREAMKQLDNQIGPRRRWPRGAFVQMRKNKRFHFQMMDGKRFASLHEKLILFASDGPIFNVYSRWREYHRLPESMMSRMRFLNAPDREPFVDNETVKWLEKRMNEMNIQSLPY